MSISEGEQIMVQFAYETLALAEVSTNPGTAAMVQFGLSLGADANAARETKVDPVTGIVTYDQSATSLTAALPDIWWDQTVLVTCFAQAGGISAATLTYEREGH